MPNIAQLSQFIEFIHNYCLPKCRIVDPSFNKERQYIKPSRRRSTKQSRRSREFKEPFETTYLDLARWHLRQDSDWQVIEPDTQQRVGKLKLKKLVNVEDEKNCSPPLDRLRHNIKERMRRKKLSHSFKALEDVLSIDKSASSKVIILSSAAKHIRKLEAELVDNKNELERLKARHRYLTSVRNRMKRKHTLVDDC